MEFSKLKEEYKKVNLGCCKNGGIYSLREEKIKPVFCKNWSCARCRKKLKYDLYMKTLTNAYAFNLDRHFIITIGGKKYRKNNSYQDSYKYMSKGWNKLKQIIKYHYGKFDYIGFPRAQKDGYCHLHLLINRRVPWSFLDKKRKKVGLGFVSIQKNRKVADYLHQDFFKDHEYYTPKNVKHYYSSRSIIINNHNKEVDPWWKKENIYFETSDREFMYKEIAKRFGRPLPFEEYVKMFCVNS